MAPLDSWNTLVFDGHIHHVMSDLSPHLETSYYALQRYTAEKHSQVNKISQNVLMRTSFVPTKSRIHCRNVQNRLTA